MSNPILSLDSMIRQQERNGCVSGNVFVPWKDLLYVSPNNYASGAEEIFAMDLAEALTGSRDLLDIEYTLVGCDVDTDTLTFYVTGDATEIIQDSCDGSVCL